MPEPENAEPFGIERYMVQKPVFALRDVVMIYRLDRNPVRSPLKDKDFTGLFGNLRDKLKGTGTRADNCNPFIGQDHAHVPILPNGTRCR